MTTLIAQAATTTTPTADWLDFLSTLVWQAMVIAAAVFFRREFATLFKRLAKIGPDGAVFESVAVQAQTKESVARVHSPDGTARALNADERDAIAPGPDGFLEATTVRRVVELMGDLEPGERVKQMMTLFVTRNQRTWLVATDRRLFYVLDDRNTQASKEFIQRVQRFDEVRNVRAVPEDGATGVIYVGGRSGWFYTIPLHPDPAELRNRIVAMTGGQP